MLKHGFWIGISFFAIRLRGLEEKMDGRGRMGGPTTSKEYDWVSNQDSAVGKRSLSKKDARYSTRERFGRFKDCLLLMPWNGRVGLDGRETMCPETKVMFRLASQLLRYASIVFDYNLKRP